ncbi:hypothetical protein DICPUDRAFT_96941 [Dictyostelium purpureum]|uniref:Ubiquinone biosynthesis protein COQ4 homolog, mitochondrial n=1 Tax=Dictyostelium purpureum TaxID=5786 RepID=F0ZCJ7_DICPU|nr:uncharacterized protein DICPUDRAFT_96941 [Dictyostelium purpureum]EGC38279.1 hypothetical protein DICPUDRAFT_96941 [Dictyostelium purpureum]|eukprot:XP_003285140.1 hypothetical protein DICPUDRAFT_96941 [Dictyostelium purpureum]
MITRNLIKSIKNTNYLKANNLLLQQSQQFYTTTTNNTNNSSNKSNNEPFNRSKIELNLFQKGLLTVGSAFVAFANPERGDMVATLGEVTGGCAIKAMKEKMMKDPVGRELLRDKPRIKESTYPQNIHLLPTTTFGGSYYQWMKAHGYTPDERCEVRMVENDDDAYVIQRYREVHDFWHVLAGIRPDVQGEIAIKWFELIQTGLPMTALSSLVGPLRCPSGERAELINHMIPWAIRSSKNCKFLMNVKYEDHWEDDINEFRKMLNFEPYKYIDNSNYIKTKKF